MPTIDLSDFENRKDEISLQLVEAAQNVGFFQIVGHGITPEEIDAMFQASKSFFALSDDIKAKYPFAGWNAGWEKLKQVRPSTGTADLKESYQIGYGPSVEAYWPSEADCPAFKATGQRFMQQVHDVSMKLMSCFEEPMGFPAGFFEKEHNPSREGCLATLRCLHYHDVTGQVFPDNYWRAGSHTDFDVLTLLFQRQGQGGLEVCPGRKASSDFGHTDEWTPVPPVEGAITINIGDMLMRWTDDRLKSNFHRVRVPKIDEYQGPRYSIAYFNQANRDSIIQGPQGKYPAMTGAEFMQAAVKRNYEALQAKLAESA